jgi:hypothetical protein
MNCPECKGVMKHKWTKDVNGMDLSVWTCVDCFYKIQRARKKNICRKTNRPRLAESNGTIYEYIKCRLCGAKHKITIAVKLDEQGKEVPNSETKIYRCGKKVFLA